MNFTQVNAVWLILVAIFFALLNQRTMAYLFFASPALFVFFANLIGIFVSWRSSR